LALAFAGRRETAQPGGEPAKGKEAAVSDRKSACNENGRTAAPAIFGVGAGEGGVLLDRRRIRVLLVEDEQDDADIATAALIESGGVSEVVRAQEGGQALEILASESSSIGLVILDLNLPGVNGFEILSRARAIPGCAGVPIVVLTTSRLYQDMRRALRDAASSFITKPDDLDELECKLAAVVDGVRAGMMLERKY
jgi:CheY-like chemotaxis protein